MEKIFESKILIQLQEFGKKVGQNLFLSAMQSAMMALTGLTMIGAISQILCSLGSESFLGLFQSGDAVYTVLNMPYQFTMNYLTLWIVALFSFSYAKNMKLKAPVVSSVNTLISFLLVAGGTVVSESGQTGLDITFLGAQGMFVGFMVVFVSIRIEKFCVEKNIRIKMPDVVPSSLQNSFAAIVPFLFTVIVMLTVSTLVTALTGGAYTVCTGFKALLAAPLGTLTSVPGMFVLAIFAALMWCFGIHGSNILSPIVVPLTIQAATTNAALHEAGQPLIFFPIALYVYKSAIGGTGNTFPLVLMGLRSKSKQIKAVSKISLVPGWFLINEPLTFGLPIMYNPILCIPYVLNIPVIIALTWIAYETGFLSPAWIPITVLLPIGFTQYFSTLKWKNAIWDYLMMIPCAIIYYPFFKMYEKQLVAKEQEMEASEA